MILGLLTILKVLGLCIATLALLIIVGFLSIVFVTMMRTGFGKKNIFKREGKAWK